MEWSFWLMTGGFFAGLLFLLAAWQRWIERAEQAQTLAELRDAQSRGTHRAVAQFPHVETSLCIGCASCVKACPEDGVLGLVDGIARVVHASRCVGHGRCEEACPVGAIKVGLGDLSLRPDIPALSENLETTVPGVYIAGELGGIALIRHALEQGARAVEAAASRPGARRAPGVKDVLIVGAGPAGLSAALKAAEKGLDHLVLDQEDLGGAIRKYPRRKLTLVQAASIPLHGKFPGGEYEKEELIRFWEGLVRRHNLALKTGVKLTGLKKEGDVLTLETTAGPFQGRAVVLALGRRGTPRKLGVPGEEAEKVMYQLLDAATYTGRKLLVVGGGDSAVEAAMGLANQKGNTVTLSYRQAAFSRLKARNEARIGEYMAAGRVRVMFSSNVARIEPEAVVLSVEGPPKGEVRLENDFVFVFAGGEPPFPLLKAMGVGFTGDARPAAAVAPSA